MKKIDASQFQSLLAASARWIDVRASIEFQEGAIPNAVNIPLLTNAERHEIGIVYKTHGQAAAIARGHELVGGATREERLARWVEEVKSHPDAVIYCFRGGLRSQTVQQWLAEEGYEVPIVTGGYKALRRFLLAAIETITPSLEFEVVSGLTGSGKTAYIKSQGRPYLDLEGLAKHRGSAFGSLDEPQPSQSDFENLLSVELIKLSREPGPILVESESRLIGRRSIPAILMQKIKVSPRQVLETPFDERIENIYNEYILGSRLGTKKDITVFNDFRNAIGAISKKLGGLRTQEILKDLDFSSRKFEKDQTLDSNRIWIRKLIEWYYDPRYRGDRD